VKRVEATMCAVLCATKALPMWRCAVRREANMRDVCAGGMGFCLVPLVAGASSAHGASVFI
jgi:hypothetical protein